MEKQLEKKQPSDPKPVLILTVPYEFDGIIQIVRPDGKVLLESALKKSDDSSNPSGPPPPHP